MTTELVLLLAVYAAFILGLFLGGEGAVNQVTQALPKLSARIEKHTATGYGFWRDYGKRQVPLLKWESPPP